MMGTAFLEQHTYPDGYGREHLDKPFWIARCDHPNHGPIALNSGHHYTENVKHHAEELIARHDVDDHHQELPIPASILAEYGNKVTWDVTQPFGLLFGFTAADARLTVTHGPASLAAYLMQGDTDSARWEARRIALARDALPTLAECAAIPYKERLTRTLA